eukprot:CAMPEP_0198538466 /NCGR_PEP_ID=MMETSP1462-20131121/47889_1 /TAXON_ID=1333877 /ORGANISM="Brandtodinium nutriculum, Strain RCC3387" /LENGTH=136 /DNA_ID=CAMNT_0044268491 /DNA_START=24 /DNA_END=432 /DNA_ORIENTATION=-
MACRTGRVFPVKKHVEGATAASCTGGTELHEVPGAVDARRMRPALTTAAVLAVLAANAVLLRHAVLLRAHPHVPRVLAVVLPGSAHAISDRITVLGVAAVDVEAVLEAAAAPGTCETGVDAGAGAAVDADVGAGVG